MVKALFIAAFLLSVTVVVGGWYACYLRQTLWSGLAVMFGLTLAVITYPLGFGDAPLWAFDAAGLLLKIGAALTIIAATAFIAKIWIWEAMLVVGAILAAALRQKTQHIRARLTTTAEMPAITAD